MDARRLVLPVSAIIAVVALIAGIIWRMARMDRATTDMDAAKIAILDAIKEQSEKMPTRDSIKVEIQSAVHPVASEVGALRAEFTQRFNAMADSMKVMSDRMDRFEALGNK